MSLQDRLRSVVRPPAARSTALIERFSGSTDAEVPCVSAVLGGAWRTSDGQRFLAVSRTYQATHSFGDTVIGACGPPDGGGWAGLLLLASNQPQPNARAGRVLFLDLETTGLAGGAGTYAFLVGLGWFDGASFTITQLLLTSASVERALLETTAALASEAGTIVTYNGKAFDIPLVDTRFSLHRMRSPLAEVAHLDMLPVARRLWRSTTLVSGRLDGHEAGERASCRLSALETAVLGHARRGDVPGSEIPSRYFHYVRTGDARPLDPVLEHNRLDLLALAILTSRVASMLELGPMATRTAREALGLGWLYQQRGLTERASACLTRAVDLPGDPVTRAEALWSHGVACRRAGCFDRAADVWQRLLAMPDCPARVARDAAEALAVHHEHRRRDFASARRLAAESLRFTTGGARRAGVERRLERLDRRINGMGVGRVPLLR